MLGAVIAHAPEPPAAVAILDRANQIIPTVNGRDRRGGSVRVLLTASAAAALIAGLIAITVNRGNEVTPSVAPSFSPPGTELQLAVAAGTASTDGNGVVKPDSSVQVTIADRFNLSWYTTVAMYEGHAVQMDCDFHGGCSPYLASTGPHTARVTDSAGKDFWSWVGVPSDATYVVYSDGETVQWEHPVRGIAAFPVTTGHKAASVTALDDTGQTLATADLQNTPLGLPPFDWSRYRDLTAEQQDQMHLVINDAMTACLQTPDGSWTSCVEHADQILVQWFDDRANERRANDGTTP
ncbi:MAG: hypothetical protein ABI706_21230 [Ilumatobacteraceae bacterium]